jgi:hypothetical protein
MKQRLPLLIRASLMFAKRDIMRSMDYRVRASIPDRLVRSARRRFARHVRWAVVFSRPPCRTFVSAIVNVVSVVRL